MELNNNSIGKQSNTVVEVSEPAIDYLDGKGAVSDVDGNITFFVNDTRSK